MPSEIRKFRWPSVAKASLNLLSQEPLLPAGELAEQITITVS